MYTSLVLRIIPILTLSDFNANSTDPTPLILTQLTSIPLILSLVIHIVVNNIHHLQ